MGSDLISKTPFCVNTDISFNCFLSYYVGMSVAEYALQSEKAQVKDMIAFDPHLIVLAPFMNL